MRQTQRFKMWQNLNTQYVTTQKTQTVTEVKKKLQMNM